LIKTGVNINCDRCKKHRPVTDEAQISFYEKFAARADKTEAMCAAVVAVPGGEHKRIFFEWLCPDCALAVSGYLEKVEPPKARGPKTPETKAGDTAPTSTTTEAGDDEEPKDEPKDKEEPKPEPKPEPKAKAKVKEPEKPAADEPDRDAAPPPVSDNDLFDEM
jgi:hypothetical protein